MRSCASLNTICTNENAHFYFPNVTNLRLEMTELFRNHLRNNSGVLSSPENNHAEENPEKRYHCRYCDKNFKVNSALKVHERFHTGEKAFSCAQCNSAFYTLSSLKKHLITYSREKPFKCQLCQQVDWEAI